MVYGLIRCLILTAAKVHFSQSINDTQVIQTLGNVPILKSLCWVFSSIIMKFHNSGNICWTKFECFKIRDCVLLQRDTPFLLVVVYPLSLFFWASCVPAQILQVCSIGWPHTVWICVCMCVILGQRDWPGNRTQKHEVSGSGLPSSPSSQFGIQRQATHTYQNMHTSCQWHLCDTCGLFFFFISIFHWVVWKWNFPH